MHNSSENAGYGLVGKYYSEQTSAQNYADPNSQPFQSGTQAAFGAMSAANDLARRVQDLVDRICGAVPVPMGKTADQVVQQSTMDQLRRGAFAANEQVSLAQVALDRLEREI